MESSYHFVSASIERHRQAIEADYEALLTLQRQQFEAQVLTPQLRTITAQHNERVEELEAAIQREEGRGREERKRKQRLRLAGGRLAGKLVDRERERAVVTVWKRVVRDRKRRAHMDTYCRSFYHRGLLRAVVSSWKFSTDLSYRSRAALLVSSATEETEKQVYQQCHSELATLRSMVGELTEDLRRETQSKNAMRRNYEESLLRSISALDLENSGVQRDIQLSGEVYIEHQLSPISRSLVYSAATHS